MREVRERDASDQVFAETIVPDMAKARLRNVVSMQGAYFVHALLGTCTQDTSNHAQSDQNAAAACSRVHRTRERVYSSVHVACAYVLVSSMHLGCLLLVPAAAAIQNEQKMSWKMRKRVAEN